MKDFIALLNEDERHFWFQQDGAKLHTADKSLDFLSRFFEDRVILEGLWTLRNTNLTPCYFFGGFLKDRVNQNKPRTLDELKLETEKQIQFIHAAMCEWVFNNIAQRINECKSMEGGCF